MQERLSSLRPRTRVLRAEPGRLNHLQVLPQIRIRFPRQNRHASHRPPRLPLLGRNLHSLAIRDTIDASATGYKQIRRQRLRLLFLDQLILMLDTPPIFLHIPQPARHNKVISRNDRTLRHILLEIRARVRVRDLTVLLDGLAPLVRGRQLAVAVRGAVQRVAYFVHHHRQAAPVVVAFALLVEERDVVVRVVPVVALVVGQHQHAFDVGAGADGDAAE